jgi:Fe-S-cluster-containing dehydrogenase component
MSRYILSHDYEACIGCQACEIHCKTNKGLGPGASPCKILATGPVLNGRVPSVRFVFMPCFHCEDAWCLRACPTGAVKRRDKDGIVYIDQSLCIGCKSCITACPWGAAQWDPGTGKAIKCDLCKERLDEGLKPACVTKCVTQCLELAEAATISAARRRHWAGVIAAGGELAP